MYVGWEMYFSLYILDTIKFKIYLKVRFIEMDSV